MSITGVTPNLGVPDQSSSTNAAQRVGTLEAARDAQDSSQGRDEDIVTLPRQVSADIKVNAIDERKKEERNKKEKEREDGRQQQSPETHHQLDTEA